MCEQNWLKRKKAAISSNCTLKSSIGLGIGAVSSLVILAPSTALALSSALDFSGLSGNDNTTTVGTTLVTNGAISGSGGTGTFDATFTSGNINLTTNPPFDGNAAGDFALGANAGATNTVSIVFNGDSAFFLQFTATTVDLGTNLGTADTIRISTDGALLTVNNTDGITVNSGGTGSNFIDFTYSGSGVASNAPLYDITTDSVVGAFAVQYTNTAAGNANRFGIGITAAVPFEVSPALGLFALGGVFGAHYWRNRKQTLASSDLDLN